MDTELKWLFAFFITLAVCNYSSSIINDYWKHQLAMEAVKSGLSQDKNGHWTKQSTIPVENNIAP
jgi:hypothetical protein